VLKDLNLSIVPIIMENSIIEPDDSFDFSKLSLTHPVGIQGGAYFTKIEYNNKPLYIQTPKSLTRQGFVKTGKKYYCDLMFDKNSEMLIHWFENLEEKCQKLIYEKNDAWFQKSLEENDIESAFNSVIRVYKSGKYYLVRTNIKNSHVNIPSIKIYNELQVPLTMDDINSETSIISILEIQGIKFTSRNFQIEIDLKQVMVLDNEPIFDNFLIKPTKNQLQKKNENLQQINEKEKKDINENPNEEIFSTIEEKESATSEIHLESNNTNNDLEPINIDVDIDMNFHNENNKNNENNENNEKMDEDSLLNLEIEDLNEIIEEEDNKELKEVDIDLQLENNNDTMKLKKPNQVYFELYKEARKKAKVAKKTAILAYLEAKNIKKTYMLENMNDSDSEFDAEIDEISESELEGL